MYYELGRGHEAKLHQDKKQLIMYSNLQDQVSYGHLSSDIRKKPSNGKRCHPHQHNPEYNPSIEIYRLQVYVCGNAVHILPEESEMHTDQEFVWELLQNKVLARRQRRNLVVVQIIWTELICFNWDLCASKCSAVPFSGRRNIFVEKLTGIP